MQRSQSIAKLTTALAKAQATMEGAAKDSDNPFFKSKYADLASCWTAWRPAGPPNGLALMQFATATEERLDPPIQVQGDDNRKAKTIHFIQRVSVETLLSFEDEWVSETLTVLVKDDSPQSTILGETYCRRGGMCAVIGIAPEDDDGDGAANHGAESGERRTARETMPTCPQCSVNLHVIKGKEEFGGGWVCYTKKGGCGAKWQDEPAKEPPPPEPKKEAKKADPSAFDSTKFVAALESANDSAAIRKIVEGLDKKPMPLPDKCVPYREAFLRLLALDNPDLAWAETKLTALRQTTCLDDVTFTELINKVEARQQPA